MSSPSQVAAAKAAANRDARTRLMAETMVRHEASDGACTFAQLAAAGFAEAEIEAYRDDARRLIAGLPFGLTIERDLCFEGHFPLTIYADAARQCGGITEDEARLEAAAVARAQENSALPPP